MAERIRYVDLDAVSNGTGTEGSPYNSMANWQSGESAASQQNRVTNAGHSTCYIKGSETVAFTMSGWTTNSSYHVRLFPWSGSEGDGTPGSYPKLSSSSGHVWTLDSDYIDIEGLEFHQTGTGASDECIRCPASSVVTIKKCLIHGDKGAADQDGVYTGNYAATVTVQNCVVYGFTRAGLNAQNFSGTSTTDWFVDSCLVYDTNDQASEAEGGISCTAQNASATVNMTVDNTMSTTDDENGNAAAGTGLAYTEIGSGTVSWGGDYNASGDTSATGKFSDTGNNDNNVSLVDTDQAGDIYLVTELLAGSENWTPVEASIGTDRCVSAGATTLTEDLIGTTRPQGTDDRGPLELVPGVSTGQPAIKRAAGIPHMHGSTKGIW